MAIYLTPQTKTQKFKLVKWDMKTKIIYLKQKSMLKMLMI